jgi:hypothetical protein
LKTIKIPRNDFEFTVEPEAGRPAWATLVTLATDSLVLPRRLLLPPPADPIRIRLAGHDLELIGLADVAATLAVRPVLVTEELVIGAAATAARNQA